jgi:hypothetical protein
VTKFGTADPTATDTPYKLDATKLPDNQALDARGIAAGPSNVWVADFGGTMNGRVISVALDGTPTAYKTGGGVQEVQGGPNGQVAFSNPLANPQFIGRIAPGGQPQDSPTPMSDPFGIAWASQDGAYWIAHFLGERLTRLTPNGDVTTLPMPAGSGPRSITTGPNNTLWVSFENSLKVARISGVEPPPPPPPPPAAPPVVDPPVVTPPVVTPPVVNTPARPRFGRTALVDAVASLRGVTASRGGTVALAVRNRNPFAVGATATLSVPMPIAARSSRSLRTVNVAAPRSFTLGARGTRTAARTLSFQLTRSARARLGIARRMTAKLTVVVRDPSGGRRTVTRAVTLRAPAR